MRALPLDGISYVHARSHKVQRKKNMSVPAQNAHANPALPRAMDCDIAKTGRPVEGPPTGKPINAGVRTSDEEHTTEINICSDERLRRGRTMCVER